MLGPVPGGATSPQGITDLQLLNGLDQIRDAAVFSPSLDVETQKMIVDAADAVKGHALLHNGDTNFGADWETALLEDLSTNVLSTVAVKAQLDEETSRVVLEILDQYVPEKDLLAK